MAKITAEFLKSKGIADDVAQEIISNLTSDYTDNDVVKSNYVDKAKYDTETSNNKEKLDNYNKALKEIQKLVGADDETGIAKAIGDLKESTKTMEKKHKSEIQKLERSNVDERLMAKFGAINSKTVMPLLDNVDENVDIATYETMRNTAIEKLSTSDDTKFLFKSQQQVIKGAEPGQGMDQNPPGGFNPATATYDQLCQHLEQNPGATL